MSETSPPGSQRGPAALPAASGPRAPILAGLCGFAVALGVGWLLWGRSHPSGGSSPEAFIAKKPDVLLNPSVPQLIPFETAAAKPAPPLPLPPITARIVTIEANTAPAYAPLEGRIDHVAVKLGEIVPAGAHLALVRSAELASMLRDLRSSSALAETKRALASRMQLLTEARGASENDLLVARNDLREAQLQASTANARLMSLSIALAGDNQYWLLAPRGGVVTQIDGRPGQHIGPNRDQPVVTLANLDEVLVLADVPQRSASSLHIGDPVDIRIPGDNDSIGSGTINNIAQVVDPERQTVPIRVLALNPDHRLRPNAFVEAHISSRPDSTPPVLQVPTQAVVSDGLESVVFVEVAPGHFRRTEVTVGRQSARTTEIRAGIKSGDKVVTRGALLLLNALDVEE